MLTKLDRILFYRKTKHYCIRFWQPAYQERREASTYGELYSILAQHLDTLGLCLKDIWAVVVYYRGLYYPLIGGV